MIVKTIYFLIALITWLATVKVFVFNQYYIF